MDSRPRKTHCVDRVVQRFFMNSFKVLLRQVRSMQDGYMEGSDIDIPQDALLTPCCGCDRLTCEAQLTIKAESECGQSLSSL